MDLPFCSYAQHRQYLFLTKAALEWVRETHPSWSPKAISVARGYKFSDFGDLNEFMFNLAMQRDYRPTLQLPASRTKRPKSHDALLLNRLILTLPSVIQHPIKVYRYFMPERRDQAFNRALHSVGSTVVQNTFWSTTCLPQVSLGLATPETCCFLELLLPAEYPALYAEALVPNTTEMEFLLAPLDAKGRWRRWLVSQVRRRTLKFDEKTPLCYNKKSIKEHFDCLSRPPAKGSTTIDIITLLPTQ